MNVTVTIDKAGRVVIPKQIRDELALEAGDILSLESQGDTLTLRPIRAATPMLRNAVSGCSMVVSRFGSMKPTSSSVMRARSATDTIGKKGPITQIWTEPAKPAIPSVGAASLPVKIQAARHHLRVPAPLTGGLCLPRNREIPSAALTLQQHMKDVPASPLSRSLASIGWV
jgi:AbrB family looped-hinge helix DNA binding protein